MSKRLFYLLWMACSMSLCVAHAAAPLKHAHPIPAGGEEGFSPMSFGMTYNNAPRGAAFLSSEEMPDLFVGVQHGTPEARGLFRCAYAGRTAEGDPIYHKPQRITAPWSDVKKIPSNIRIFQDGEDVWMVRLTKTTIQTFLWDGRGFEEVAKNEVSGFDYPIASFDMVRRHRGEIEIAVLCHDGGAYRPATFPGDKQSYYDGAGIYRGALHGSGLFRLTVSDDWQQISPVEQVSSDMHLMVGASRVACVYNQARTLDGYLIAGRLGSLKYIPYTKRVPKGGLRALHVMKNETEVRVHSAYSTQMIALPTAKEDCSGLFIGGEAAMYAYEFAGFTAKGAPIYADAKTVVERNAPLYGGSLTVPNVVDWDGDGVLDIVAGNSEGRLLFFKNRGTDREPDFARSTEVEAGGKPILLRPGYYVVQGPFEASWGYLCPTVFDWNGDGLLDVVTSGSRAKYEVMLNRGTKHEPKLDAPFALSCDNLELHGSWRVRPALAKVGDQTLIITMDDENALHLYGRVDDYHVEDLGKVQLHNGRPITGHTHSPKENMGQWGRGKLRLFDWNGDGKLDLFIGSVKRSSYPSPERGLPYSRFLQKKVGMQVMYFENVGTNDAMRFAEPKQLLVDGEDFYLGAHSNAPEPCYLGDTSNGPNLVVGAESGKYFFFEHQRLGYAGYEE